MTPRPGLLALVALALVAGCSSDEKAADHKAAGQGGAHPPVDRDADRKAIEKARKDFDENNSAGDVGRTGALYAPDAVLLPHGLPPLVGQKAIVESLAASYEQFYITSSLTSEEVVFLGDDWALDRGRFKVTLKPKNESPGSEDNGSYLVLWQRQPDGSWKIARDIDSSYPATEPAPE